MAKSLRSKWKRKMRALKRVKYGEKELSALKSITDNASNASISAIIRPTRSATRVQTSAQTNAESSVDRHDGSNEHMQVDANECRSAHKSGTRGAKRDTNGHYPVWMNGRQIRKMKTKLKRIKTNKKSIKQNR